MGMMKNGVQWKISVVESGKATRYFVFGGGAWGSLPGGYSQQVFCPAKPGFEDWFQDILRKHGHPDSFYASAHTR
jgi:hypothetical protein